MTFGPVCEASGGERSVGIDGDDGWPDVLAKAKAGTSAPPDLATLIKPAPTPAEQAHKMITETAPDKIDFAQWEFVLTNGSQEDQDMVWNAIKGKAVQMNGTVISTEPRASSASSLGGEHSRRTIIELSRAKT